MIKVSKFYKIKQMRYYEFIEYDENKSADYFDPIKYYISLYYLRQDIKIEIETIKVIENFFNEIVNIDELQQALKQSLKNKNNNSNKYKEIFQKIIDKKNESKNVIENFYNEIVNIEEFQQALEKNNAKKYNEIFQKIIDKKNDTETIKDIIFFLIKM